MSTEIKKSSRFPLYSLEHEHERGFRPRSQVELGNEIEPPEGKVCIKEDKRMAGVIAKAWTFFAQALEQYNDRPFELAAARWSREELILVPKFNLGTRLKDKYLSVRGVPATVRWVGFSETDPIGDGFGETAPTTRDDRQRSLSMPALARRVDTLRDLTLQEVVEKYPRFPKLIAIKIDAQRRGVHYTERAMSIVDPTVHQLRGSYIFGSRDGQLKPVLESLILRDGTTVISDPTPLDQNPYLVDLVDGKLYLTDDGEPIEEVEPWPEPAYYGKMTSSGIPMKYVISARPQRLNVFQTGYCHYWKNGNGCRFCDIVNHVKQQRAEWGIPTRLRPKDVQETLREALKEPGRFTNICLTAGSDTRGAQPFDQEVDFYIELIQAVGEVFRTKRFPSQLIATAFTEDQLARLYEQTGLTSYTADIEVLDERVFNWVCPGKAEWIGYQEWKRRLIRAVDIFGRGNVGNGLVGGVELAKPYGFKTEDEALRATLTEAEELASHGVTTVYIVWVPRPQSEFKDQKNASLEYYVRLAQGLHDLRVKYGLKVDFDDYRRCGNHPDSDLARLL